MPLVKCLETSLLLDSPWVLCLIVSEKENVESITVVESNEDEKI